MAPCFWSEKLILKSCSFQGKCLLPMLLFGPIFNWRNRSFVRLLWIIFCNFPTFLTRWIFRFFLALTYPASEFTKFPEDVEYKTCSNFSTTHWHFGLKLLSHQGWEKSWYIKPFIISIWHDTSELMTYSKIIIIIIIISCWQHGYPWPSFATPPYRSSP